MSTDKKRIGAYLDEDLKEAAESLAKARGMSLSTLIAFSLIKEIREARKTGEISNEG